MTDITKCQHGCLQQDKCWRWIAPTNIQKQSFADFKPDETGKCNYFYDRKKS